MLEKLEKNIERKREIIKEILVFSEQIERGAELNQARLMQNTINSLLRQLKILNNSTPHILDEISLVKKLPGKRKKEKKKINPIKARHKGYLNEGERELLIRHEDKKKYLKELSISKELVEKLRGKKKKEGKQKDMRVKKLVKIANKIFLKYSLQLEDKFGGLKRELHKANLQIIYTSYISLILLFTSLSVFVGLFAFILVMILVEGSFLLNLVKFIWIIPLVPILTFLGAYFYPMTEASSIKKRIENELPFVTINMSAIAGSKVEPSNIFKIIVEGEEYPYIKKEFNKLLNQINLYGYDLVTALKNTARSTSSIKLKELLIGLSTNISSGGDLATFLDKRAETLLLDYRLAREKYTKTAETMMNIYISIVIAAPMIFMLMLIMISITGMTFGLGLNTMVFLILMVVALINVIFLFFLHFKQIGY